MISYNPNNRAKALKLIKELKHRGLISSEISRRLGHEVWFISGIETKGTNVSDTTLAGLRSMVTCGQGDTKPIDSLFYKVGEVSTTNNAILALLQSGKILSSQYIMRKLLSKYRVGTIQKALADLKSANKIDMPQRGYYKIIATKIEPQEEFFPWDNASNNDKSEISKLRSEIRSLRKLTKKILRQSKSKDSKNG